MDGDVGALKEVGSAEGGREEGREGRVEGIGHGDVADGAGLEESPGADLGGY